MSEKITVLRVGAKRNGYRRAGLLFGETAAAIPVSTLTKHQIKELEHDRMLAVEKADVIVVDEAELKSLGEKAAVADDLVALLPTDFTWTRTPIEYVANVKHQLQVQTERANGLQAQLDAQTEHAKSLQAQLDAHAASAAAGKQTGRR